MLPYIMVFVKSFFTESLFLTSPLTVLASARTPTFSVTAFITLPISFMDEAPVGPQLDLYAAKRECVLDKYIGTLNLAEGQNNLLFKLVGKHTESQGLGLDLTNIICERVD